jgi:regulator of protease activity HflC (stomatin/prohibitin superfamily)
MTWAAAVGAVALGLVLIGLAMSLRVVKQFERGVLFRFGKVDRQTRGPGLTVITPIVDRLQKVNMQIITMPVPAQDGITRDNVTVRVDAVVYFRVVDPVRVAVDVQDYDSAIGLVAQTSLRSIIGKSLLDDLLCDRERLNQGLELMIDSPAAEWGVHIDRVEIKDVALPEAMKRSMSRQAEAERERRARVITADGELQASAKLAEAADVMADTPAALQLRLLETIVEVAAEKNSTLVLPFPVELLRFLENSPAATPMPATPAAKTPPPETTPPSGEALPAPAQTSPLLGRMHVEPSSGTSIADLRLRQSSGSPVTIDNDPLAVAMTPSTGSNRSPRRSATDQSAARTGSPNAWTEAAR